MFYLLYAASKVIARLIGVDNILNKITKFFLVYICYVYYFMLCILVYQFELYGIIRIMYQHFKVIPCYIL